MIEIKGTDPRMIANNLEPFEPTHPGELLKEEIECRGISQKELSRQTDIPYTALNEVLNGKRAITTEYALLIEAALGIESDFWLKMQMDYNIQTAKRNKTFAQRLADIRKIAAAL
ncbi:MAG TPA: HigA family addiction module antidote protein [Candidatus Avibacteroides excrementipullorum]|nr:HigA family addiction module antidote protein [Candidatus Avibacteroides excrementipullorum]